MQAARSLIWEESYGAITIDDICRRADVRKGSFYYFFPSKADLASAAFEDAWQQAWKPFLDQHLSPDRPPVERFRAYFAAVVQAQLGVRASCGKLLGCPLFGLGNEIATLEPAVAATVRDVLARKRRYYESSIRDGQASSQIPAYDPVERAVVLQGALHGLVVQARVTGDPTPLHSLPALGSEILRLPAPGA